MNAERRGRRSRRAWIAGLAVVALTCAVMWGSAADGFIGAIQAAYVTAALTAIVGALIASRHPGNRIGWLMIAIGFLAAVSAVPYDYGYWDVAIRRNAFPLGTAALWLDSWAWMLPFGIGLPLIAVRFPSGRASRHTRLVDWLAVAGTLVAASALALKPGRLFPSEVIQNPAGVTSAGFAINVLFAAGLVVVAVADALAVGSLVLRYRHAHGDERQQLKWVASATVVVLLALVAGVVVITALKEPLLVGLVPFSVSTLLIPIAIGIAILRYRLYEIDVLINKAVVYGGVTAVLAGLYTFVIGLSQRLFVFYAGQKSDAAVLITAFLVAAAFTPVKEGIERLAHRRLAPRNAVAELNEYAERIESVVGVLDSERIVHSLVRESVKAFDVAGGEFAITAGIAQRPSQTASRVDRPSAAIDVEAGGKAIGRLVLGARPGQHGYTEAELRALKRAADAVGEAIALSRRPPAGERAETSGSSCSNPNLEVMVR